MGYREDGWDCLYFREGIGFRFFLIVLGRGVDKMAESSVGGEVVGF